MAATTCSSISVTRESANANFPEEQSSATGTSSFSAQTLLIPVRIALGPLSWRPGVVTPFVNHLAGIVNATAIRKHGGHMTTHSLGQAARLTGRGKTILTRAISGRLFAGSKEDGGSKVEGEESAQVYPFPAPVEAAPELRTRLTLAEERLSELKAMLEDMRRDRDAWREQAQTRLLPAPTARMSWWPWRRTAG
jgi:hypothetical protein